MSGHAHIKEAERPRHARAGGASTVQMVTPAVGAAQLINGYTDLPAGTAIPRHFHNCEESVLIVSGSPTVEIDGHEIPAEAGEVVWIKSNLPHHFRNETTDPVRIFWTYASADATRTLVETGETARVAVEHQ